MRSSFLLPFSNLSGRRLSFPPWHSLFPFSPLYSLPLLLLSLRQRDKVNVNGSFTLRFFLPAFQIPSFVSPPRHGRLFTSPRDSRIMTKIWRAQRWFPSDAFRIFQERVFPPRQAVTLAAGWLQKSFSHHLCYEWLRGAEFTRKLNEKKKLFEKYCLKWYEASKFKRPLGTQYYCTILLIIWRLD